MRLPTISVLALTLVALSTGAQAGSAQTLGLDLTVVRTGYDGVLSTPVGGAGSFEMPVVRPLFLRVSGGVVGEEQVREGYTCTGLVEPGTPCPLDILEGRTVLLHMGLELGGEVLRTERFRATLALGGLVTAMTSRFVGRETGREVRPVTPGGSPGWSLGAEGTWWLRPRVGVALGAKRIDPALTACGADAWFPFCEDRTWWSTSLGVRLGADG